MANDFTPPVQRTIEIYKSVGHGFTDIEWVITQLWGDLKKVQNVADDWQRLNRAIQDQVQRPLDNEIAQRFAGGAWSGDAKDQYTTWVGAVKDQTLTPLAGGFGKVHTALSDIADAIIDIRRQVTWMCSEFVVACAAAGIGAAKGSPAAEGEAAASRGAKGTVALVALLTLLGKLVWDLYKLLEECSSKFAGPTNSIENAFSDPPVGTVRISTLNDPETPVPGMKIPVVTPSLPLGFIADPKKWGDNQDVPKPGN
ncbi:WXG100 family type VII secretion target [Actinomadura rupiterrae]|uniref:WXG100 family type VII secretion target n=1 Tax=Actinomadura rupiterrae TaxID=559627 RepID=UPI0020A5EE8F|nr:WXG100 family type VII secretion target [Actinomadura rupiterrae]MCP2341984.1 uncharacterized protein YukE [Actinomadura rupiterrae]